MANKRDLKKKINFVFADIIEEVYLWELENPKKDAKTGEAIIDDVINSFDEFIARANQRAVENPSKHYKSLHEDLEKTSNDFIKKVKAL